VQIAHLSIHKLMPPGNVILAWNNIYLDLVRKIGGAPGPLSRIGGLMHLAMYIAVRRLTPGSVYPDFKTQIPVVVPAGKATPATTAAYAACYVLTALLKEYIDASEMAQGGVSNPFDPFQVRPNAQAHASALAIQSPSGLSKAEKDVLKDSNSYGTAIGKAAIAAHNATAGFDMVPIPAFARKAGEWRPTDTSPATTPNWGKVPLLLLSPGTNPTTHYLPTILDNSLNTYGGLMKSPEYAMQLGEVKLLGEANSTARSREQTEIAFFWANDLNGTSKPPGQLYTIVQAVAQQQGTVQDQVASGTTPAANGLLETARLFAMVGAAMVNAAVVAWQAKYFWPTAQDPLRLWRPESAIHLASTDGNPSTATEAAWRPLSAMGNGMRFSPSFPAYVSGHSTFGAAFAAAMSQFFGRDGIPFTATTEDPHALVDENGIRKTRSFTSFTQSALENGRSRVYLGVHYQFDANGGYEIGTKVGLDTAALFGGAVAPHP
jgi:PAP2 superfamily